MTQAVSNNSKSQNLISSVSDTARIALEGGAIGGGIGLLLSNLPANKSAIKDEITNTLYLNASGGLTSDTFKKMVDGVQNAEQKNIFKSLVEYAKNNDGNISAALKESAQKAVDDIINKLPKNSEFYDLVKKSAKRASRIKMVKTGFIFGAFCMLAVNLINDLKQNKKK